MSLFARIALAKIKNFEALCQALERLEIDHSVESTDKIEIRLPGRFTDRTYRVAMVAIQDGEISHYELQGDFDYVKESARGFADMILKAYVSIAAETLLASKGFIPLSDWESVDGQETPFNDSVGLERCEMVRVEL